MGIPDLTISFLEMPQVGTSVYTGIALDVFKCMCGSITKKFRAMPGYPLSEKEFRVADSWPVNEFELMKPGSSASGEVVLRSLDFSSDRPLSNFILKGLDYSQDVYYLESTAEWLSFLLKLHKWLHQFLEFCFDICKENCIEIYNEQYVGSYTDTPILFYVDGEEIELWVKDVSELCAYLGFKAREPNCANYIYDFSRIIGVPANPLEEARRKADLFKFVSIVKETRKAFIEEIMKDKELMKAVNHENFFRIRDDGQRTKLLKLLQQHREKIYSAATAADLEVSKLELKQLIGNGKVKTNFNQILLGWI